MKVLLLALVLTGATLSAQTSIVAGETAHLIFRSAPLRGGSVGRQIEDAVKDLKKAGAPIKIRVFATPTVELKAVNEAIVKAFPPKVRPAVSVIQIARLPDAAASVLVEAVLTATNIENPNGVAFISGQLTQAPTGAIAPLVERSLANLNMIASGIDVRAEDVLRVNCYTSSLDDYAQVRAAVLASFAKADVSVMQIQRTPANQFVECDAVARLNAKPAQAVRLINPTQAAFAQAAVVNAPRILFTSAFASTSSEDAGVRAALSSLQNTVQSVKVTMDHVIYVSAYPGNQALLDKFRALRFEVLVRSNAPASTNLVFEGTGLSVDAMAW